MVVLSALICKCIQTTDIKKNTQCFCFLLSFSLLSTLHSGFCPAQKLLLSKLPGRRPSPTPRGSCQVRYDSVLTSLGLPVTLTPWATPSFLKPPPHWVSRSSPFPGCSLYPLCWILSSTRWRSPEFSSYTSSLTSLTSSEISPPVPRPTFRSLTKTSPWSPGLNLKLPLLRVHL